MKHQPSLDGLRGIAIITVVTFHANRSLYPGGWSGVDIFFVLSGYLITRLLLGEISLSGTITFKNFYMRRILRLLPAFACLILAILPVAYFTRAHRSEYFEEIVLAATYLMNWSRAFNWIPGDGGLLGHTWSLSVEEQFYIIWPISLLCLCRIRKFAPTIIAGLVITEVAWRCYLVYHGAHRERVYNGFDSHSDTLLIGCALAFLPFAATPASRLANKFAIIPIAVFILILLTCRIDNKFSLTAGLTIAGLCSAWIVVALSENGRLTRFLSLRPLVYTGKISYGWYLWHDPILKLGRQHVPKASVLLTIALSYLIAMASYHFVEQPFLRLKRRFLPPTVIPAKAGIFSLKP